MFIRSVHASRIQYPELQLVKYLKLFCMSVCVSDDWVRVLVPGTVELELKLESQSQSEEGLHDF